MKIMFINNNLKKFEYEPTKSNWNLFPSLLKKRGQEVLSLGKYEYFKFYKEYKNFKPDIIKIDWIPGSLIPLILKKLGLIKCPIVMDWSDYFDEMMTNYPRFIVRFMENYTVKNADYVTTASKRNEMRAKEMGQKVLYIPHGYFVGNKETKTNLDKLKTKESNLKVIYLGDQSKWKKVDEIIEVAKELDFDLFLIGTINLEFQESAKEFKNIHFIGRVDELEVRAILKQGDILINTSNQDCNYKFIDYISVGKPILAFDELPANVFTNRVNAYLTSDFKRALRILIENKELRDKLEMNVKKLKVCNWDEVADKHIKLYRRLIKCQI